MNEQVAPQGANSEGEAGWLKNLEHMGDSPDAPENATPEAAEGSRAEAKKDEAPGEGSAQDPGAAPGDDSHDGDKAAQRDDTGVDWEKVDLGVPEDTRPELVAAFRGLAAEINLTPEQARKLAGFEAGAVEKIRAAASEEGKRALAAEWGGQYEAKRVECVSLINAVDLALQQANPAAAHAFSKAVERTGAACDPDFVRGLAHIASLMREDSLDAARAAANAGRPETVREGLAGLFK